MKPVLETKSLMRRFGGLLATNNVSFKLEAGARQALIGPNGAGKTTFINLLTGVLPPTSGQIWLNGRDITRLSPEQRVKHGIARTFQINQLFPGFTPLETIGLAISERLNQGAHLWSRALAKAEMAEEITATAKNFLLLDVLDVPTATLPYGKQRLLEMAVAFACRPQVLLLDEPAAGVPESERPEILAAINALPGDVAVLLIEHDMDLVFKFARRISVLVNGALFAEGSTAEIAADPKVKSVYLGEEAHG